MTLTKYHQRITEHDHDHTGLVGVQASVRRVDGWRRLRKLSYVRAIPAHVLAVSKRTRPIGKGTQRRSRGHCGWWRGGRLVFHVLAAVAEYDREMIVEGTMDGLAAARSRRRALAAAAGPGPADVRHQRTHRRPRSPKKQLNQVGRNAITTSARGSGVLPWCALVFSERSGLIRTSSSRRGSLKPARS
jgi:hypothetical protein